MSIFKQFDFSEVLNKKNFEKKTLQYLKKHPCCKEKNCTHPLYQSDEHLWKDKDFYPIAEKVASIIFNHYKDNFNLNMRMWAYYQKKDSILDSYEWHNHYRGESKEELSFIIYLSDTELGTLFKVNQNIITLKPKKNILYAWNSKYEHTPELGKHLQNRVILAGDCLI